MADVVTMPKLGFDMAEGTLVRWVKTEGEQVTKGDILAEIETDKATVEVESNFSGVVKKHLVSVNEIVPVNTPIAVIGEADEKIDLEALGVGTETVSETKVAQEPTDQPETEKAEKAEVKPVEPDDEADDSGEFPGGVKASPLARRIAQDKGYDLRKIKGSGPGGRIVKTDVENYQPAAAADKESRPTQDMLELSMAKAVETERVPLNRLRSAIGRRMTEAKQKVPHFYVTYEYEMKPLLDLRKQVNAMLPDEVKISVNDFIIKAVALALRQYPNLNASLEGNEIVRHGPVNMGVAVAVEGGLLTVVCRDADRKPLRMIAAEVSTMVERARDGKVRPDDIEGSTFSISNLGMFGVESFVAIINPPEAAILAVGSARETPVIKDGQIVPGLRMKATISVDHRVSDGAEAARFMQSLAEYIEEPLRLLL
ncbi:MAG TPA: dihydrolipoamide acetyltransferase family protein [Anaerolineales bacterium]|nr:dihydrolipoamide acetyltransferase family protein [Anaerolineales bacterium]